MVANDDTDVAPSPTPPLLRGKLRQPGWHRGAGEVGAEWGVSTGRELRAALFRVEGVRPLTPLVDGEGI